VDSITNLSAKRKVFIDSNVFHCCSISILSDYLPPSLRVVHIILFVEISCPFWHMCNHRKEGDKPKITLVLS